MSFRSCKRHVRRIIWPVPRSYGREFGEWRNFLDQSQWWTPRQLEDYQNRELRKLIQHSYDNVPYYREVFNEYGLTANDIQQKEDLKKLPFLTKDVIKANSERLQARNIPKSSVEFHTTGGTTGTPLAVALEKRTDAIRMAFEWRFYNWAGYHFGDRCAVLRGRVVEGFEKGRRIEYDPYENYLVLSAFDMSPQTMQRYAEELLDFRPKFIQGYPSSVCVLAQYLMDNGLKVNRHHNLQAIITSSETLYPFQRQQIGEAFEVPVFDHYGNTEQAGRFGQCKCLDGHHEFSEHSVIETLNEDSSGGGEIVATALTNYAMPLIRYRTGDAIRRSDKICKCGRGLPLVVSLEGRKQDVALLKDGTPVSLTGFFFAVHVPEMSRLRKIQFQQEEPGHLRAMVVKGELYQEGACEAMLERMNRNLAKPFRMEIQYVDEIPTTRAGKHQFFVSKIRS